MTDPAHDPNARPADSGTPAERDHRPEGAETGDAQASNASVDASAIEGALQAPAVDTPAGEAPPADAPVAAAVVAEAEAPAAEAKPSRRPAIMAGLRSFGRRLALLVLTVALFAGGVVLGNATYVRTRPAPLPTGDVNVTDPPATVAQEFIFALGNNDADALRSSLDRQPNKDLTDEFTRFDIKKVTAVETLGTSVDGNRSATEIVLHAEKSDGMPFEVNLVILVEGNKIEGFR